MTVEWQSVHIPEIITHELTRGIAQQGLVYFRQLVINTRIDQCNPNGRDGFCVRAWKCRNFRIIQLISQKRRTKKCSLDPEDQQHAWFEPWQH